MEVDVIAMIDKKFSGFNLGLPRKPLTSVTLGQMKGKLVLNAFLVGSSNA